jgi:hypothetical protein
MERIIIYAKPSATKVIPSSLYVLSAGLSSNQLKTINILGKSFYSIRNLYLSASDTSIFTNLQYSFFNPFSSVSNLYSTNIGFSATVIPTFTVIDDRIINFDIPDQVFYNLQSKTNFTGKLDVIVENEAGYSILSRDSYAYPISTWSGFTYTQSPCISGIIITT